MRLDIGDADIGDIVASAILQSLDAEKKEEMIKAALKHLITPRTPTDYRDKDTKSPLEQAFTDAASRLATKKVLVLLETDSEFDQMLDAVIREGIAKALTGEAREKLVENVSDAVSSTFWRSNS